LRKPVDKTIRIKGSNRTHLSKAWGRGGKLKFYSPPKGTRWGGGFGIQVELDQPTLGLFVSPREARQLATELIRRADDLET
jgi:hypothetical protein